MQRLLTRWVYLTADAAVLGMCYALAFVFRFDWELGDVQRTRLFATMPLVVAVQYTSLYLFGVPRFAWRYVGLRESKRIAAAVLAATPVLLIARFLVGEARRETPELSAALIPLGVIAIDACLAFLGTVGVRVLRRMWVENRRRAERLLGKESRTRTLLIGAGRGGLMVAKELEARPDLGMEPVGFIDDDAMKVGTVVHGLRVLGTMADLKRVCDAEHVSQALVTISNAPGTTIRAIAQDCERAGVQTKVLPALSDFVSGRMALSTIRDVAIEDLLRRAPVDLDMQQIGAFLTGRSVMITGAGGSIGSELCRQVCKFGPQRLLLVERSENNLFNIHCELLADFPSLELVPCIADVTDELRMRAIFESYRPTAVLHAAAHKHVPMMEWNPGEAVKNNVGGTRTTADLSDRFGVERFVLVSTDKAVNPTSVMGATKRAAELYLQTLASRSETRFMTVRFGNVLGSAGSVVPTFRAQIAKGGPVTVTHPDMRRYFMTIPEACQLVLQAASMGEGGEIFVLDMGEPVRIVDLASDLIRLSGLRPGVDIDIEFTGIRPGEKLFEELSTAEEAASKTRHPKIFVGRQSESRVEELVSRLGRLLSTADKGVPDAVRRELERFVPTYAREPHEAEPAVQEVLVSAPLSATPTESARP